MSRRLIFVYNANLGNLNALMDSAHKLFSPSTYNCQLCKLTHHHFGEKSSWKQFKDKLTIPFEFLHKDEFERAYPNLNYQLPVIFFGEKNRFETVMSASEIKECKDLDELIQQLNQKL